MRKVVLLVAVFGFTGHCVAQAKSGTLSPSAVWQPPQNLVASANKVCGNPSDGRRLAECFIAQMAKAGAPVGALDFTRKFYKENHGEIAILTLIAPAGQLDMAWVVYPLRQPSNYGLVLVNGDPVFVNTEDLNLLDQRGMEQSFEYQALKSLFPKVTLFPGKRDRRSWPKAQTRPGGWRFIIDYPLRNGCPTCSNAGAALFAWNFDSDRKFVGTSFMGLTPAPSTSPVSSPQ